MFFKKKTLMLTLGFGSIILGSGIVTTINELGKNTNILPNLKLRINNGEIFIGSINDAKKINNELNSSSQIRKVSLTNDVDLASATLEDFIYLDELVSEDVREINGNGYSIKNKPSDFF